MPTTTTNKLSHLDIISLPNYKLHHKGKRQYTSTCPVCGGTDRFCYWEDDGNYWCRQCELQGFVDEAYSYQLSPEQLKEIEQRREQRKREELQQQASVLNKIGMSNNPQVYHNQMQDRWYWYKQGLSDAMIDTYLLGWTPACPTYPQSPSWTIPIYYQNRLYNIRHRLEQPNGSGRYRPEMVGLPSAVFNADAIRDDWMLLIVEGEIKTMVLRQYDFTAIGLPGKSFKDKWIGLLSGFAGPVYVVLDPGAEAQGGEITKKLRDAKIKAKQVFMPVKPDDFFVIYNGTNKEFFSFLMMGK